MVGARPGHIPFEVPKPQGLFAELLIFFFFGGGRWHFSVWFSREPKALHTFWVSSPRRREAGGAPELLRPDHLARESRSR